ncbi:MAG: hypothetical protein ACR2L1_02595 [Pyrinomonadaceae bacterium]
MKKITKAFVLAAAAGIFSVTANAQTDNSKIETIVLEKMGETKTIEYSLKPGETQEIAVVDSKAAHHLLIKSSQQGVPSENPAAKTGSMPSVINSSTITTERWGLVKVQAKTNWTLKKDGKETAAGSDAYEYGTTTANTTRHNTKFAADTTQILPPGTYVISIKCVQDKPCEDKLTVAYTLGPAPDALNLEP